MLTEQRAFATATSPTAVAKHTFYPFLKFYKHWTRYAGKGDVGEPKTRPILYAARLDACIYSYYRHILSDKYEQLLAEHGLSNAVLAYRRIQADSRQGGQCNIDYALGAFEAIQKYGQCCTIALDISKFFESLDHSRIKTVWAELIGKSRLPDDHFAVFRAITKYSYVDYLEAYERLGYYGPKKFIHDKPIKGYLKKKSDIPVQICSGPEFRRLIAGEGPQSSIIKVNPNTYGIPQGAPLSDLLSNLYMLDFDRHVKALVDNCGGKYFRYSDDILIVMPQNEQQASLLEAEVRNEITKYGNELKIKEEKCAIHRFYREDERQRATLIKPANRTQKPFEYLGFRFDGKHAYIRDKTMSNLHRKIARASKATAIRLTKRYPNKTTKEILDLYNFEALYQSFGPVENFRDISSDYKCWTFRTYSRRTARILGPLGAPIERQTRNLRKQIRTRLEKELQKLAPSS